MTRRYLVQGRVQGVGFRWFARAQAVQLGLAGWVRNLPDGAVEALGQGEPLQLESFEAALRAGPPHARVERVEISEISDEFDSSKVFEIR
jgi:acylphosphatase